MTNQVYEALNSVKTAMDGYNQAIDTWISELQQSEEEDPNRVLRLQGGARAMRDSSGIYLAWAQHLANGMPEESAEQVG